MDKLTKHLHFFYKIYMTNLKRNSNLMTSEVLMLRTFVVMYSRTAAAARSSKEARHSEQKDKEASYRLVLLFRSIWSVFWLI